MVNANFSRIYNPHTDDFDDIVARARPLELFQTTFLSATAIRLDFAPVPAH